MSDMVFDVHVDEYGNFCAQAEAGDSTLFTDGKDLNELHAMILDVLRLYELETGLRISSYALRFSASHPVAA